MVRHANHVGLIHVQVSVSVPGGTLPGYQGSFLVDTGVTDSMAAVSDLSRAGIQPVGRKTCETADGSVHEYRFGLAQIEVMGEVTAGRVICGREGVEPILGVTVLESIGLIVDPASQSLRRLPTVSLKRAG